MDDFVRQNWTFIDRRVKPSYLRNICKITHPPSIKDHWIKNILQLEQKLVHVIFKVLLDPNTQQSGHRCTYLQAITVIRLLENSVLRHMVTWSLINRLSDLSFIRSMNSLIYCIHAAFIYLDFTFSTYYIKARFH